MNQYMCEFNQLKEERERLRQKRESIVNTEHHCVCEQSSSTDCEHSSSTDTPQHSLIDLLEKYVQSDAFALSEFSKIYRTAFGTSAVIAASSTSHVSELYKESWSFLACEAAVAVITSCEILNFQNLTSRLSSQLPR